MQPTARNHVSSVLICLAALGGSSMGGSAVAAPVGPGNCSVVMSPGRVGAIAPDRCRPPMPQPQPRPLMVPQQLLIFANPQHVPRPIAGVTPPHAIAGVHPPRPIGGVLQPRPIAGVVPPRPIAGVLPPRPTFVPRIQPMPAPHAPLRTTRR